MIRRFVILGASGDLTSRYLVPALARLSEAGQVPAGVEIVGVSRETQDTETFRRHIAESLPETVPDLAPAVRDAVLTMLTYRTADVTDRGAVANVLSGAEGPAVVYLALPPAVFADALDALASSGLPQGSRIVVEKPFGEDLASAQMLNRRLHEVFPEHAVFRMDHFLGKQTVQNILGLRFANRLFEPVWSGQHVDRVEIIWDESLAVEGRGYYDAAGALRDMVQNHLLQLLCLVAMEAPPTLHERDFRDAKVHLLRAVRGLSPEEVERHTVRGRYGAGRVGDRDVRAYVDNKDVDAERETETFAQIQLAIDNWRWSGVPFVLRSGKALARDRREIAIHFKPVAHLTFGSHTTARPNVVRLTLDPDRVAVGVNINGPGDPFELEYIELDRTLAPHALPAYGRLLLDVLDGDPTLSIRDDEAEESWRIVEPILAAWRKGRVPLVEYPAGSDGPGTAMT